MWAAARRGTSRHHLVRATPAVAPLADTNEANERAPRVSVVALARFVSPRSALIDDRTRSESWGHRQFLRVRIPYQVASNTSCGRRDGEYHGKLDRRLRVHTAIRSRHESAAQREEANAIYQPWRTDGHDLQPNRVAARVRVIDARGRWMMMMDEKYSASSAQALDLERMLEVERRRNLTSVRKLESHFRCDTCGTFHFRCDILALLSVRRGLHNACPHGDRRGRG